MISQKDPWGSNGTTHDLEEGTPEAGRTRGPTTGRRPESDPGDGNV